MTSQGDSSKGVQETMAKKPRLCEETGVDQSKTLAKTFEREVIDKLRSTEEQLKEATNRLDARLLDLELAVCLAENRLALTLDPRYLDHVEQLKQAMQGFEELVGKHGIASTTL